MMGFSLQTISTRGLRWSAVTSAAVLLLLVLPADAEIYKWNCLLYTSDAADEN